MTDSRRRITGRLLATGLGFLGLITLDAGVEARVLDPAQPEDALEIFKRAQCGVRDGEPAVFYWTGRAYGRRAGEPDKLLFNLEGMNIRQCVPVTDPQRGAGFRLVSREIMLYVDPATGQVLRQWTNPYTGKENTVLHVANDPVNQRPMFARDADGKPMKSNVRVIGNTAWMALEAPLFYSNPLAGDYQDYVGNKYHAMEIFDFSVHADTLFDTRNKQVDTSVAWVRLSQWMPWMKMEGRDGMMVFNAVGTKLGHYEDLPPVLRQEIQANYPAYVAPPPGDDARPNETTWTVTRRWIDEQRESGKAPAEQPRH